MKFIEKIKLHIWLYAVMFAAGSHPISYVRYPILLLKVWKWEKQGIFLVNQKFVPAKERRKQK